MVIHLHLGCGLIHRPGQVNVDRYVIAAADLQADALLLPFPAGTVESITALQLVEHLGDVGTLYALHEWARVLAPGGALRIETPQRTATLRAAVEPETRPAALPWLFGTGRAARGQVHRTLFDGEELAQWMAQAGFEEIEVQRFAPRPARPTLRLTARRGGDTPTTRFIHRLRRGLVTSGVLDPLDAAPYLVVLEDLFRRAAEVVASPGDEALIRLVSLAARYSPRVGTCVLAALPDTRAWPREALSRADRVLAELEREGFTARLACRWRQSPRLAGTAGAAWADLEREISLYLTARLYPGQGLDGVRAAFDAATAGVTAADRRVGFFCRPALTDLARRLTGQGVRAFAQGRLEAGARMLETALAYDPDLVWPRWNLARLYLRQGRRLDGLVQYEQVQAGLPAGLRPAYEREMDAVTGRAGQAGTFAVPLADPADLLAGLE